MNAESSESEPVHPEGTGQCTRCACSRYVEDPADPGHCINAGTYPNLCQHPKGAHR